VMSMMFPSHHGLLQINNLPHVGTLVPASDRFSSLRGLSAPSSTGSSGGVGENNLAFKCTRKRLVFETFHLDAEGGVGERRTTPAANSFALQEGADTDTTLHPPSHDTHNNNTLAAIEVRLDEDVKVVHNVSRPVPVAVEIEGRNPSKKKPKKKVGFHVERPDLYDF